MSVFTQERTVLPIIVTSCRRRKVKYNIRNIIRKIREVNSFSQYVGCILYPSSVWSKRQVKIKILIFCNYDKNRNPYSTRKKEQQSVFGEQRFRKLDGFFKLGNESGNLLQYTFQGSDVLYFDACFLKIFIRHLTQSFKNALVKAFIYVGFILKPSISVGGQTEI